MSSLLSIRMLNMTKLYCYEYDRRGKIDYNCFYQVTEQDIADSIELVRQFIGAIEKLINEK